MAATKERLSLCPHSRGDVIHKPRSRWLKSTSLVDRCQPRVTMQHRCRVGACAQPAQYTTLGTTGSKRRWGEFATRWTFVVYAPMVGVSHQWSLGVIVLFSVDETSLITMGAVCGLLLLVAAILARLVHTIGSLQRRFDSPEKLLHELSGRSSRRGDLIPVRCRIPVISMDSGSAQPSRFRSNGGSSGFGWQPDSR